MAADPAAGRVSDPVPEPEWLTVAQAARRLGCSERAVRKRVERGRLEVRREREGNRVRTLVRIPGAVHAAGPVAERAADPGAEPVTELRERAARLEERLAAAEGVKAELRRQVEQARADLEREWGLREEAERHRQVAAGGLAVAGQDG